MTKRKNPVPNDVVKPVVDEEHMTIQANFNNLDPGNSKNELRAIERGYEIFAEDEIKQQNNNL